MAQQTINVGTAPNDGTGTPLRTAFQYTNSNFSELYTALGGGSGLPGAANQIIFNNGSSLAGNANLTFNTALNKLVANNIETAANLLVGTSATITGAASAASLTVTGSTIPTNGLYLPTTNTLEFAANSLAQYRIAPLGVFSWYDGAGGTRMTLNATGLGVGVASPATKLDVRGATNANQATFSGTAGRGLLISTRSDGLADDRTVILNAQYAIGSLGQLVIQTAGTDRLLVDNAGNVGIGVTPSAWQSTFKALQSLGGAIGSNSASQYNVLQNAYINTSGAWAYTTGTTVATMFRQNSGAFEFFNASGGASPSWIQAMTLDASGNLLVGTTNTSSTAGVGFKSQFSSTVPQFAIVVNEAGTSTNFSIYNVNAAAYRFYVNNGGTVFATNTTISAISDARLKENVQDIDVGLGAILALKPRKFDWKAGKGKDIKGDRGFIAQEFEQVFPQLVDEWKDAAPEGEAPYKSVRQDLIPVLVKAIQELTARVQTLETR